MIYFGLFMNTWGCYMMYFYCSWDVLQCILNYFSAHRIFDDIIKLLPWKYFSFFTTWHTYYGIPYNEPISLKSKYYYPESLFVVQKDYADIWPIGLKLSARIWYANITKKRPFESSVMLSYPSYLALEE